MIAGFPTETEQDHQDTLSLMEYVKYILDSTLNVQEHWREEKWKMILRKQKPDDYKKL
jgi:tRNA A37 methylthiotransferase MiaB